MGALAVALGIGVAIANGSGLAVADTTGGSKETSSASESKDVSGADAAGSTEPASDAGTDDSGDGEADEADEGDGADGADEAELAEDAEDAGDAGDDVAVDAESDAETDSVTDETPSGDSAEASTGEMSTAPADPSEDEPEAEDLAPAADEKRSALRSEDVTVETTSAPPAAAIETPMEPETEAPAGSESSGETTAVQVSVQTPAIVTPEPEPVETVELASAPRADRAEATRQVGLTSGLLAGFASLLTTNTGAGNGPVTPPSSPTLWAVLGWIRRQIEYSFFYSSPTTGYHLAANEQSYYGVVSGAINPSQANGDKLTLSVVDGPDKGTVMLNQDGTFAYAPNADFAVEGGRDTFTVLIDTREGNPFHVNLLKLFRPGAGTTTTKVIEVNVMPTSPLGTPEQIQAERIAELIVASDEVQAAMAQVRQAWLTGTEAVFGAGNIDAANLAQLDAALEESARAAAINVQGLDPTNPQVLENLLPPHTWYGQSVGGSRVVYDNPDTLYRFIPVNSASTYIIEGHFADGRRPADTNFSVTAGQAGTVGDLAGRDLVVRPDGTFTITVSSEPAAPGEVNHIQIPANATYILARNTLGDWNNETAMSLTVTRISGPPASTAEPTMDELVTRTVQTMLGSTTIQQFFLRQLTINPATGELREPNTLTQPFSSGGLTLATQLQSWGYFQLADDEAMVVTVDPGRAGYFVVPVTNVWTSTANYWDEQTSLNNFQAIPNPDGTYTFVISPTDPGVANWVSTGGLSMGTLYLRFQDLDQSSADNPTVSTAFVKLDQLATAVPDTMVYVTDEERAAQIELRREGFFSRFAPFPQETTEV
ncbi:hypothetical protein JDV09_19130 [Mycobacterium sp. Y57]|nr:hypothetical protein [Mycolicibacterium xanthum]